MKHQGLRTTRYMLHFAPLTAITLLAAIVRLYHLGEKGLWADEIFTAVFAAADNSWGEVAQHALNTPIPSPPLWFWITHAFLLLFGEGDAMVRLPSALAGILSVPVLYLLGRRLFDARTGLVAALLLALAPLHVYHSQEARFYAVVPLLSMLSLYGLWVGLTETQARGWALFTLANVVSLYIHLTTFLVLAAEGAFAAGYLVYRALRGQRSTVRDEGVPFVLSLASIGLAYLPMLPYLVAGATGERGLGSQGPVVGLHLSPAYVAVLASLFGAGVGWALSLYGAAFLVGWGHLWQHHRDRALLITTWIVVPFLVVVLLRPKHWFAPKYVISIMPIYLLTVAWGLGRVGDALGDGVAGARLAVSPAAPGRIVRGMPLVLLALLFAGMSTPGLGEIRTVREGAWRDMARILQANAREGDAIAFLPLSIATMPPESILLYYYAPPPTGITLTTVRSRDQVLSLLATHRRLWLVAMRKWQRREGERIGWRDAAPHVQLPLSRRSALIYMARDRTQEQLLEEVAAFQNLPAVTWGGIGEAYAQQKAWDRALSAYQRAAALEPGQGIWRYHMARMYEALGWAERAQAEYEAAIRLEPEVAGFHAALADFLARTGRPELAVGSYRRAIALYRDQYPADVNAPHLVAWQEALDVVQGQGASTRPETNTP